MAGQMAGHVAGRTWRVTWRVARGGSDGGSRGGSHVAGQVAGHTWRVRWRVAPGASTPSARRGPCRSRGRRGRLRVGGTSRAPCTGGRGRGRGRGAPRASTSGGTWAALGAAAVARPAVTCPLHDRYTPSKHFWRYLGGTWGCGGPVKCACDVHARVFMSCACPLHDRYTWAGLGAAAVEHRPRGGCAAVTRACCGAGVGSHTGMGDEPSSLTAA